MHRPLLPLATLLALAGVARAYPHIGMTRAGANAKTSFWR
jgi:hypothetical protein